MTTIHHLFELQAMRAPLAVALISGGLHLTYRELNERAEVVAGCLRLMGVGPNVLVGLCLHRSVDMIVGLLGILKAGGAYVPIDPRYPRDRIAYMLEDSNATAIVTQASLLPELPQTGPPRVAIDQPLPHAEMKTEARIDSSGRDLAYVIYTSGSTGRPKGVEIEHRSVVNFLESMRVEPGLAADDVVLALTTLSFDIAALEIFLPLTTGARIVLGTWETAVDSNAIRLELENHKATVFQATPTTWRMLLNSGWAGDSRLKALCGGEPMSRELAERLIPRCGALWNMYGPTETTIWSTSKRVEHATSVTIGRPIKNTEVLILDSDLRNLPPGEEGELFIGGEGLARGYHNQAELTAAKFIEHPSKPGHRIYRTGDLAKFTPSGELQCLGRVDLQIKIRGFRIELGEIESVLSSHPAIDQVVVAASRSSESEDPRIIAYFTTASAPPTPMVLREYSRAKLADYMLPVAYVRLSKLPLTPNGKVDRTALPQPSAAHLATSERSAPPNTPTEKRLARIWCKVLGLETVGRHDSFFDLGGNSILAAAVFTRIEIEFDRRLPLAALFKAQTIAELAGAIELSDPTTTDWASLAAIQPNGSKPILFCMHGAGGNILLYHALVRQLGDDYPVYGLHSRGLDGKTAPFEKIEEMAARYVREVQQLQPRGPYCLAGYCMGGTIAYEMAQLLRQKGEQVELLALLDTYNFSLTKVTSPLWDLIERIGFHAQNFFQLSPQLMKGYLREKRRVASDGELAQLFRRSTELRHRKIERSGQARLRTIQAINDRAAELYVPKPYDGRLTIIKPRVNYAKYPDQNLGWRSVVSQEIDLVELPINPHAMLVEPSVKYLAAALRTRLAAVGLAARQNVDDVTGARASVG